MELPMIPMRELIGRIRRGEAMILLDLRNPAEYKRGHLAGAVNIPYEEFAEGSWEQRELPTHIPIFLYCARGSLSLLACRILREKGYPAVSAAGGLSVYRGPLIRGPKP